MKYRYLSNNLPTEGLQHAHAIRLEGESSNYIRQRSHGLTTTTVHFRDAFCNKRMVVVIRTITSHPNLRKPELRDES